MDFKIKGNKITNSEKEYLSSLGFKWCSKCKSAKKYEDFSKSSQTADGYNGQCKDCVKFKRLNNLEAYRIRDKNRYDSNRDKILKQAAEYRANNGDKIKESKSSYYKNNKETILKKNANYRKNNLDSIKVQQKKYRQDNFKDRSLKQKAWRLKNRLKINKRQRDKYQEDPLFKARVICREMVRRMLLSTGRKKNFSTKEILGYSPEDLRNHIEKQFKPGMTWENYGEWHIDHIIPISRAENLAEGIVLSQLSNLQPLWAEDNLSKGNKL